MQAKILKSKWYLTRMNQDHSRRIVLTQYGDFDTLNRADAITWQLIEDGFGIMERKPEFDALTLPVSGERILKNSKWYDIPEALAHQQEDAPHA